MIPGNPGVSLPEIQFLPFFETCNLENDGKIGGLKLLTHTTHTLTHDSAFPPRAVRLAFVTGKLLLEKMDSTPSLTKMQRMYMHTNASTVVGGCERDEGFLDLDHPRIPTDAQGSE